MKGTVIKMNIVLLDAGTLGDDIDLDIFDKLGDKTVYGATDERDVAERIENADIVIINKVRLYEKNLSEAKKLKLICIAATGFDNVDLEYARKRGIAVCNVKGYSTDSVAQLTVSLALSLACRLNEYDEYCKSGKYTESGVQNCLRPTVYELNGKAWGIYGYGNIGKRVGEVARALGCRIRVCKRTPKEGVECVTLRELFRDSDIVSVHTPLNAETRASVNEDILAGAKDGLILVNTARGAVFDEEAVVKMVESGKISGFATDVYSVEPMSADSPYNRLKNYRNVIFTPHNAWGAYEARVRLINEMAKNITAFFNGEIRNRVDI